MNKNRRDEIKKIIKDIEIIRSILNDIQIEEELYYDNIPENLQSSDRALDSEDALNNISDALDNIDECIQYLNACI